MKQNWNSLKETQVSSERKYKLKMRNIEIILVLEYGNCVGLIFFIFLFFEYLQNFQLEFLIWQYSNYICVLDQQKLFFFRKFKSEWDTTESLGHISILIFNENRIILDMEFSEKWAKED